MAGRNQEAAWFAQWRRDGKPDDWREKFVRTTTFRARCRDCGRKGLSGYDYPMLWQVGCLIGHKYTCEHCGAMTHNLYQHQNCKSGHTGCCTHSNTQYRELQLLLEASKP